MKFKVGKSKIEGKGLIVKEPIREGELIGLAHINDQPTDIVGKYHNHSEEPSAANVKMGNKRYLYALRELNPGDEITTDYRKQPELEQPEDFKKGGEYTPQKDGYRTYSPFRDLPYIDVESDTIDTDNIVYDLKLIADNGVTKIVAKNSGMHTIPGASVIREIPIKRRGGLVKMPKPSKKGLASKAYTKSLDGTNKLFTENYLFEKPKSRKRKVFDPNAMYFQNGGVQVEGYNEESPWLGEQYKDLGATLTAGRFNVSAGNYFPTRVQEPTSNFNPYINLGVDLNKDRNLSFEYTPGYAGVTFTKSFEKGGFHDDLGKYRKVLQNIIYGAGVGLTKAEYGMPMGSGMSQNYMGRTKSFYQEGGEERALTPTGEEDLYSAGELDQVTVKDKMPDWARFQKEYQNIKPLESYIAEEKRKYLRRGNKALNKMAGVTETNFPKDVEERFRQEYNQKMNTYATRKLGKKQGFNPRKRGEWVDELSQREFDVVAQSKYGSKLSPDVWSRFLSGAQGAANTLLPGQPVNFKIPGLTKREMQEARENPVEAFELLAPLDVPGIAIANKLTNANIENPNILSGETMTNVSPLATIGLNPLLAVDMFGLTKLPKSIYTGTKALGEGAIAAGKKASQAGSKYLASDAPSNVIRSGIGGMDMSQYEIKNPDYFTQLLDTYDSRKMSPKNRKFYEGLIASIKRQDGLATERQYNELQRLKTGDFNFGKKAYQDGGYIEAELTPEEIDAYREEGWIVEDM